MVKTKLTRRCLLRDIYHQNQHKTAELNVILHDHIYSETDTICLMLIQAANREV